MFKEVITPLIYELKKKFNITATTFGLDIPDQLFNDLETLKKENLIRNYYVIPSKSILTQFKFLKSNLDNMNSVKYDLWLTHQEFQTFELFIQYYVLPKFCKKIVLGHGISYLLSDYSDIAKKILIDTNDTSPVLNLNL